MREGIFQDDIPLRPQEFSAGLRRIFGSGATHIEHEIDRNLEQAQLPPLRLRYEEVTAAA